MIKVEKNKTAKKALESKLESFRKNVKETFVKEMQEGKTVGSICELYDIENKKYMPQGTIAQGWSVGEIFRIII